MSWNRYGGYQKRFVSSSKNSSSSSAGTGDLSNVPPPPSLTGGTQVGPYISAQRRAEQAKEDEYANLVAYGTKKERKGRSYRIYDDEYLEGENSDDEPSSSSRRRSDDRKRKAEPEVKKPADDDEEDELDAFMAGIDAQASKDKKSSEDKEKDRAAGKETVEDEKKGIGRADIDDEDMQESYFRFLEENKQKYENEEDEQHEYDEDGNIIWSWKKVIDPLPPIDHAQHTYMNFNRNFYVEHEDIKNLKYMEVVRLNEKLGLRVGGLHPPRPVCSFGHFSFDEKLMEAIRKSEYEHPTPIQAMAIPAALSGRDVLGIAKTGSGKTAAYLWPAIVHIMDQPDLAAGDGPIALVVVPTRELAIQVYQEATRFCRIYNINVICAYGGGSKWEQSEELKNQGAELVICTPGRIIDLVKMDATNFLRTTFLVFDEADRMFDMGFEAQVKSISDHIRPDRQCLMFSATFKQKVERLARDALCDPVRVVQGEVGEANADIEQTIMVMRTPEEKWSWLCKNLVSFAANGKVLIFVTKKLEAEEVAKKLTQRDFDLVLLHGDMLQAERNDHLQLFRKKKNIMVATDVAARGLDIPEIRTVINYTVARDIDTHVHRIGRTGRAGNKGVAVTLISDKDTEMAGHLVKNLESVAQVVPDELMNLAMKWATFKNQRTQGNQQPQGGPQQRLGLGYKPKTRPMGNEKGGKVFDPLKDQRPSSEKLAKVSYASGSSSGPASGQNRADMLKNAFKKSYQNKFAKAQLESSNLQQAQASDPRPEWKIKLDELNAKLNSDRAGGQDVAPQKKSRWGNE